MRNSKSEEDGLFRRIANMFKYWWVYTLISLSAIGALILMEIKNVHLSWLEDICGYAFMLAAALQLTALVISVVRRRFLVALCISVIVYLLSTRGRGEIITLYVWRYGTMVKRPAKTRC